MLCEKTKWISGVTRKSRRETIRKRKIPDRDHVLRYCSPIHVETKMIMHGAFDFRSGEQFLSVNWMEYFDKNDSAESQVAEIRKAISKKLTLRGKGRFARINVGEVKRRIENARVRHIPEPADPSHAGISAPNEQNREFSLELADMLKPNDIFPAILPK